MKSVLMSIQPKWCELIANGKKTVEVRKTAPKIATPFKVYIYCTKPKKFYKISPHMVTSDEILWLSNGKVKMGDGFEFWADGTEHKCLNRKVIGEFVCEKIDEYRYGVYEGEFCYHIPTVEGEKTCLEYPEAEEYGNGKPLYFWHISNLVIYDKPRELGEFYTVVENEDCGKCKYYDTPCESEPCNQCQGGRKYLTRPPQSWMFCESEVQGE